MSPFSRRRPEEADDLHLPAKPTNCRRRLPLWVALALSVPAVGPTLAMAGNGQGLISTVGKSIPLVFVIGLFRVALVAYSFGDSPGTSITPDPPMRWWG